MKSCAAGFTEWLLYHVWKINENTNQSCPNLLIPETVIYRLGKPFFWYYSLPSGEILRKAKSKVNHNNILEEFYKEDLEIIAYYISFNDIKKNKASLATIEFFSHFSFKDFIHNRDKCNTGILQKWISPKLNQSSMIKVQWSQQFCLIEKRTNKYKLDDTKTEFYDKIVTYEGIEHNSILEPITAPWIISEIQKIMIFWNDKVILLRELTVTHILFIK